MLYSISPSIYVGFRTIGAYDLCGPVGGRLVNKTVAFAPGELSTQMPHLGLDDTTRPPPQPLTVADLVRNCSTISGYKWFPGNPGNAGWAGFGTTKDPCHPIIVIPSKVLALDPAWASCTADALGGFYDPPHPLTAVAALDPATGIGYDPPSTQPAPGPSPQPITASKTAEASITAGVPPPVHDPPSGTPDPSTAKGGDPAAPLSSANPNQQPQPQSQPQPQPQPSQNPPSQNDPAKGDPGQSQKPGNQQPGNQQPGNQQPGTKQPGPGNPQSQNSVPAVVVQGHTISENGPVVSIGGSPVAYSSGSIYVGNTAAPAPTPPQQQHQQQQDPSTFVVAGYTFAPAPQQSQGNTAMSAVVVKGQTISENGPAVTIGEIAIAFSSGSVYVGSNAAAIPTPASQPQQQRPNLVVVAGYTFSPIQQIGQGGATVPAAVVQGHTISENGPAVTIGGNAVGYSAGSVYVGSTGASMPSSDPAQQQQQQNANPAVIGGLTFYPVQTDPPTRVATPIVVAGQTASVNAGGVVVIGGQTMAPGAPAITVGGTPVSLGASGLVVGSSTIQLAQFPTPTAFTTVAGHIITPAPSGVIAVDGTILTPGSPAITISGTPISLGSSALIVGDSTIPLPTSPSSASVFTVAGQTFTANPTGFVVSPGTTIIPGGSPITLSGSVLSLAPSGKLIIGSKTIQLPASPTQVLFTIAGQTYTANPTAISISPGTTLSLSGPALTISGTRISLGPSGQLVIGTSTLHVPEVFTVGGETFTANPTAFPIAGTTLIEGGSAITIQGTIISLGPSGLVIGTNTIPLETASVTGGLGGVILSGLGPVGGPPSSTGVQAFLGGAARMVDVPSWMGAGFCVVVGFVFLGAVGL